MNKYEAEKATREDRTLALVPVMDKGRIDWLALPKAQAEPLIEALRAEIGPLTIELRKIKHASFASEETNCFDAEVWVNGKKAGRAHNAGHGGPTSVDPTELNDLLDRYGATLPLQVSEIVDDTDPTGFFTMQPDAEHIVDELLEKHLKEKDAERETAKLRRDLQCRLLYTKKGEKGIYQTKKLEPAKLSALRSNPELRTKWSIEVLLNDLPFPEAQKVFNDNIKRVYR